LLHAEKQIYDYLCGKFSDMLLSLFLFFATTFFQTQTGVKNINQAEFQKLQADKNTVIIDVRTPEEIKKGYIKGTTKFIDINGNNFDAKINSLDKNKTYIMVCHSGGRSSRAAQIMTSKGFKKVYNLSGGVSGWSGPLTK